MTSEDAMFYLTESMMLTMILSMPPIIVASLVGIVVSLLQALTQVQEQTLSFAIKLIAVAVTIVAMSGLLGSQMLDYTLKLFNDFPQIVGFDDMSCSAWIKSRDDAELRGNYLAWARGALPASDPSTWRPPARCIEFKKPQ